MYFDALTMAAMADELQAQILGGRVQKVLLPDELSIGMEIYAHGERKYLLASAHPEHARLYLTGEKLRRGTEKTTPLLLLMRKYVRGGRIAAIEHPPFERVLHIGVQHPAGNTTLIIEVMGRYSNIVLVAKEGLILDSVKRVRPEMSRYRSILPQRLYVPPPPQSKLDPTDVTELRLRDILTSASPSSRSGRGSVEPSHAPPDSPIWRVLVEGIAGVSPLMAREVAYRAMGDAEAVVSQVDKISPLLDIFQDMLIPVWEHRWQPSIVREGERVVAFAPYLLTQYGDWEEVEGISQAVRAYYTQILGEDAYVAAKRKVRDAIQRARERVRRRQESLERARVTQAQVEELRRKGEMILAYAHLIQPGQRKLAAPLGPDEQPLLIELDPSLSPVENAQRYFERYKKAKRAAEEIPAVLRRAELELRYLDQLETDLELAANWPEIQEVKACLAEAGYIREKGRRPKAGRSRPLAVKSQDGFLILVGRNSLQNEEVTFRRAAPNDLWLHARGVPGAHVIIRSRGREVPEATLRQAAQLAAYYSQARGSTYVDVDYTERRHVRPIKGGAPSLVTYAREKTIRVAPEKAPRQ